MATEFDAVLAELAKLPRTERLQQIQILLARLEKPERKRFKNARRDRQWFDAVHRAIHDYTDRHQNREFTRAAFHREELERICGETQAKGKTPEKTLDFYMQRLRDARIIAFVDNRGTYRCLDHPCDTNGSHRRPLTQPTGPR